jgi:ABC-2 type transport system ATP-binding protein
VGEASFCDYVGLLSDGELLMFDTPQNLRRAAFDGEVVDVVLQRAPSTAQLENLAALPLVIGEIDRIDHVTVRIVVRDAGQAITELSSCMDGLGLDLVDATEHIVDYDEAFVRVVERHRAASAQTNGQTHGAASNGQTRGAAS